MPFPPVKRIIFDKNPLDRVICQIRFPTILKIESELPARFQDEIRNQFPFFNEKNQYQQEILGIESNFPIDLSQNINKSIINKNYEFLSEDSIWKLNLTRTFIAISTTEYKKWEDFKSKFEIPFKLLLEIYKPNFITRVGLRYTDIFDRKKLGLDKENWKELLQSYFIGLLASDIGDEVRDFTNVFEVNLEDGESIVRITTSFVYHKESHEKCFMADSDFFTTKRVKVDKVFEKLDFLHDNATRLIQFIIKDKLRNAMEPKEL